MKKILSLGAVLFALTPNLDALENHDDVGYMTFKYGLTTIEDNFTLNQNSFGVDFIGEIGRKIKPKLDFTYVSIDKAGRVDYLFQTSINAYLKSNYVYQSIIPYFYGGLGYEYVGGARSYFDSNFYLQEAVGIEIPISQPSDDLHIVTELRLMQIIGGGDGQDSEISLFIGLKLPFGKTFSNYASNSRSYTSAGNYAEFDEPSYPSEKVAEDLYVEPSNVKIGETSQFGFSDADGDGVSDDIDICPNSPYESAVNKRGCPIRDSRRYVEPSHKTFPKVQRQRTEYTFKALPNTRKILDVHFKLNSDEIAESSRLIIRKFVEAVNRTSSKITVEGYTDSTGLYEQNIALSQRRADAVKNLMIQYGVDSSRITSVGKGSISPISTNETEKGRAENRRIEIVIE
jgi:OOP family OmpA-OmpF porin